MYFGKGLSELEKESLPSRQLPCTPVPSSVSIPFLPGRKDHDATGVPLSNEHPMDFEEPTDSPLYDYFSIPTPGYLSAPRLS